jgi:hypothetical protein
MENLQVKITTKREAIEDAEKSFKDLKKEAKKTGSAAAKYFFLTISQLNLFNHRLPFCL